MGRVERGRNRRQRDIADPLAGEAAAVAFAETNARRRKVRQISYRRRIHEAFLGADALSDPRAGWHAYLLFDARPSPVLAPHVAWHRVDDLLRRPPRVRAQEMALRACLARVHERSAPFDALAQCEAIHAWVRGRLRAMGADVTGPAVPRRLGRFDTIRTFPTTRGPVCFKGGSGRTTVDAQLVQALHQRLPAHLPALLAHDLVQPWSLTTTAPGVALSGVSWNREVSCKVLLKAVTLLARSQRGVLESDAQTLVESRRFGPVELTEAIGRTEQLLEQGSFRAAWPRARVTAVVNVLWQAATRLITCQLPWTWTPVDFTVGHLFVHEGLVRFDGVDEYACAPPVLALSRFLDDLLWRGRQPQTLIVQLEQRYIDEWRGRIGAGPLRRALRDSHLLALLLGFHAQADRLARAEGFERPDALLAAPRPELAARAHLLASRLPRRLPAGSRVLTARRSPLRRIREAGFRRRGCRIGGCARLAAIRRAGARESLLAESDIGQGHADGRGPELDRREARQRGQFHDVGAEVDTGPPPLRGTPREALDVVVRRAERPHERRRRRGEQRHHSILLTWDLHHRSPGSWPDSDETASDAADR